MSLYSESDCGHSVQIGDKCRQCEYIKLQTRVKDLETDRSGTDNYNVNAGHPAFPLVGQLPSSRVVSLTHGLTKREYFAAMALSGICADSIPGSHHTPINAARHAIEYADALLAALTANRMSVLDQSSDAQQAGGPKE